MVRRGTICHPAVERGEWAAAASQHGTALEYTRRRRTYNGPVRGFQLQTASDWPPLAASLPKPPAWNLARRSRCARCKPVTLAAGHRGHPATPSMRQPRLAGAPMVDGPSLSITAGERGELAGGPSTSNGNGTLALHAGGQTTTARQPSNYTASAGSGDGAATLRPGASLTPGGGSTMRRGQRPLTLAAHRGHRLQQPHHAQPLPWPGSRCRCVRLPGDHRVSVAEVAAAASSQQRQRNLELTLRRRTYNGPVQLSTTPPSNGCC